MNTRTIGKFTLRVVSAVSKNPPQLTCAVLKQSRDAAALKSVGIVRSVTNRIKMICLIGIPSKVRQAVVRFRPIVVAGFHSIGTWANKGFKHERMQCSRQAISVRTKINHHVSVWPRFSWRQYSGFSFESVVRRAGAFNAAQGANGIVWKSPDRQPALSGYFLNGKILRMSTGLDRAVRAFLAPSPGCCSAIAALNVQPVHLGSISVKPRLILHGLTGGAVFFLYSYFSHASSPQTRMRLVRPVRMFTHSLGSLCIIPQNSGAQS